MTIETVKKLGLTSIRTTPTILEMDDKYRIKPEGILDELVVSIDPWEYPVEFFVLQPIL